LGNLTCFILQLKKDSYKKNSQVAWTHTIKRGAASIGRLHMHFLSCLNLQRNKIMREKLLNI
jgi:hypothetical protein